MTLCMTGYINTTVVLGPSSPPTPKTIQQIIQYGRVEGAILPPILIDQLCSNSHGLSALRTLDYLQYVGAPLGKKSGTLLSQYVRLAPSIGSTEAGGYFIELRADHEDWDYVSFQPHAGAIFEHRNEELHELVFVRQPECAVQPIFLVYPDKLRFETNDLWIEHETRKGLWKIVGRTDDYVLLSTGEGLHASSLEPEFESLDFVKAALIGGHGRLRPVLILELIPDVEADMKSESWVKTFKATLTPHIEKVNSKCHPSVRLSPELILFADKGKPFERTIKGNVARAQSLKLYEQEMRRLPDSAR